MKIKFFFTIIFFLLFVFFESIQIKYQDLVCNYKKKKRTEKVEKVFKFKNQTVLKIYNEKFDHTIGGTQGVNVYKDDDKKIIVLASGYYSGAEILDQKFNKIYSVELTGTNDPLTLFADGIQYDENLFFFTDFKGDQLLKINIKKKKFSTLLKKNLNKPIGIDKLDKDLIISDYNNNLIKIVSINGRVKKRFRKIDKYCLDDPYDIKVKNDKIFFVDRQNKKILITNKSFKVISIINSHQTGQKYFKWPQHIDIHNEKIYVMDTRDKLIKVFDLNNNKMVASLTHKYISNGSFRGLAVDHEGYIYLTGTKKMRASEKDMGIVAFYPVTF